MSRTVTRIAHPRQRHKAPVALVVLAVPSLLGIAALLGTASPQQAATFTKPHPLDVDVREIGLVRSLHRIMFGSYDMHGCRRGGDVVVTSL